MRLKDCFTRQYVLYVDTYCDNRDTTTDDYDYGKISLSYVTSLKEMKENKSSIYDEIINLGATIPENLNDNIYVYDITADRNAQIYVPEFWQ